MGIYDRDYMQDRDSSPQRGTSFKTSIKLAWARVVAGFRNLVFKVKQLFKRR